MVRLIIILTFVLSGGKIIFCDNSFNFIWYKSNNTHGEGNVWKVGEEIDDNIRENAKTIVIREEIPILRKIDLKFATNLFTLVMKNCDINDIDPGAFSELQPLQLLDLSKNNLRIVKEQLFNNVDIKQLNLSYNKIITIKSEAFDNMPNLETVLLDHNEISTYNIDFLNCPKLSTISLQYNFIDEIPANAFQQIKQNKINIYLSYNKVTKLEDGTFDLPEIGQLHLDHNELVEFNNTLRKLGNVDLLNLDGNYIKCLPNYFLDTNMAKVKVFNLMDNPVNCTCADKLIAKGRDFKIVVNVNKINC